MVFNQFDFTLGLLQSITIDAYLTKSGGAYRLDNDSETSAGSGTVSFQTTITLSSSVNLNGVGPLITLENYGVNMTVNNLDATGSFQNDGGPDNASVAGVTQTDSDNTSVPAGSFNPYKGFGTYTVNVAETSLAGYSGSGTVYTEGDPVAVSGSMTITYSYDDELQDVPEPGSVVMSAFALAGIVSVGVWRKLKKTAA